MKKITLTRGYSTLVDNEDFDLSYYKWHFHDSGKGYAASSFEKKENHSKTFLHRVVFERMSSASIPSGMEIDHINGNSLDNRRSNLRMVTSSQNKFNKPKKSNNTSGYKGVSWHKSSQKWRAEITVSGKRNFVGLFNFPEDAARARDIRAKELIGEFDMPSISSRK